MGDIALKWDGTGADLAFEDGDLVIDDGLQTAVIVSLFSDRRARSDDTLPDGSTDRRGWWADQWAEVPGDQLGSRLWLLGREKELPEPMRRARDYAMEALSWLTEDGIAASVDVQPSVPRRGVLGLAVAINRRDGGRESYQFEILWEAMNGL